MTSPRPYFRPSSFSAKIMLSDIELVVYPMFMITHGPGLIDHKKRRGISRDHDIALSAEPLARAAKPATYDYRTSGAFKMNPDIVPYHRYPPLGRWPVPKIDKTLQDD
jgi:hypothetical protein